MKNVLQTSGYIVLFYGILLPQSCVVRLVYNSELSLLRLLPLVVFFIATRSLGVSLLHAAYPDREPLDDLHSLSFTRSFMIFLCCTVLLLSPVSATVHDIVAMI